MKPRLFSFLNSAFLIIISGFLFSGCASTAKWIQTWSTYKFESVNKIQEDGKSGVVGQIRATYDLEEVVKQPGYANLLSHDGYQTQVIISKLNITSKTDCKGKFEITGIEPGCYTLYYKDYEGKKHIAEFCVNYNLTTKLKIFVQIGKERRRFLIRNPLAINKIKDFSGIPVKLKDK